MKITIGHKTPLVRFLIIISGVALLFGVNLLLLVPESLREGLALTVVGGLMTFWLMRNTGGIIYTRQEDGMLSIRLPGGKTVDLKPSMIIGVKKLNQTPLTRRQHIGVKRLGDDRYITTSNKNLYEISVSDGRKIVISPRSPKKIFDNL